MSFQLNDKTIRMTDKMRQYSLMCVVLLMFIIPTAQSKEAINHFHSDIVIEKNGQITVTETIEVKAENILIKRGIYRDFPTKYFGEWWTKKQVDFEITRVTRNNQDEPYHTKPLKNGIRIFIGSGSKNLQPGIHKYQLTYKTDKQLGYFEGYDEFYWNVTGNGWQFEILKASTSIQLPENGPNPIHEQVQDQQAWTGYRGEQNKDFIITNTDALLGFETTKTLKKHQGLTIGIQVPKGIFDKPSFDLAAFIANNLIWIISLLVMLFYFGFYLTAWYRFGRDPETGVIIARFKPPEDLSAAAVHYIDSETVSDKTMTAALLSLAVKGHINITQQKKQYLIKKLTPNKSKKNKSTENMTKLSMGERVIMRSLFPGNKKQTTLSKKPNSYLRTAKNKLTSLLHKEYKKKCFADNKSYMIWGWVISSVCLFVVTLLIYNQILNPAKLLILIVLCLFFLFVATAIFATFPIIASLIALLGLAITFQEIFFFLLEQKTWLFFTLFLFGLNLLFTYLMRSPTVFGRHIKDQIDGLKLYMKSAEENRLNILNPPDENIENYERLLPYAVALNLENQWAEKFSSMVNTESSSTNSSTQIAYQPSWYTNQYNSDNKINFSVASISRSLKRSVAASTTNPTPVMSLSTSSSSSSYASSSSSSSSSSSYSSGSSGGSSGGGGGGGGGGGW